MSTQAVITDSPALASLQQRALTVGVIGLVASLVGAAMDFNQFIYSWLIGFLFCLGLTLARLEARVAMEELFKLFRDWEVDNERAVFSSSTAVRGWDTLPVAITGR